MTEGTFSNLSRFGRLRKIVNTSVEMDDGLKFYRFLLECGHDSKCNATQAVHPRKKGTMRCPYCVQGKPIKDPIAVIFGRRGGLKGGLATTAKYTPEERSARASHAARSRWNKELMTERKYQLPPELPPEDPLITVAAQKHVIEELTHKIQHLVEMLDGRGLLEDHAFTFPDGDVWKAQDVEPPGN